MGPRGNHLTRSTISVGAIGAGPGGAGLETLRLVSFTFIPIKDEEAPRFPPPPLLDNQNEDQPKTLDFTLGELLGFELDFLFHQNVTAFPAGCQKLY